MRDYVKWHEHYDDPTSGISWRLAKVQGYLQAEFDERPGPLQLISMCAGDGRDVLGVLEQRPDPLRLSPTLVELQPELAESARQRGARFGVEVRTADAGRTDAYVGATPADVLLMVGVLGNVTDADVVRTVAVVPQLCAQGALVVWSRGLDAGLARADNDAIRVQLHSLGCTEIDYAEHPDTDGRTSVGAVRFAGEPEELRIGERFFTFVR